MSENMWVLFDLDGTLTRSEEGIWNCARHTLRTMGYPEPDAVTLRQYIGPPLFWSFRNLAGMGEEEALRAIDIYRARYNTVGLFENRVYPGIRAALRALKKAGAHLGGTGTVARATIEAGGGFTAAWWIEHAGDFIRDKVLKGKLGDQYAEPQGRIKIVTEDPSHAITVTNGTADLEKAAPGETVTLKADDPAPGEVFDKWVVTEGDVTIKDPAAAETSFVMGDADVKVEATYKCDGGDNCPSKSLVDVDRGANSWYHEAVDWAVVNKVTNGIDPTHFGPTNACTRAQAVTFLWRAMGEPEPTLKENPFKDVAADAYYYKAVLWAAEKEITNGVTADTFAPDATCTRGQIVTFLWRAEGKPASEAEIAFTDVPADAYFADAVAWAVENGITNGTSPTTFAPNDNCTRAHIVTFLYRDLA